MFRGTELTLVLSTLVFAGSAAGLAYLRPFAVQSHETAATNLRLRAVDDNGRLRVDWDAKHQAVLEADAAALEVQDGGRFERYPIDRDVLRKGGFDYIRKSSDVLLTLTLYANGQAGAQATVRSIGAPQLATTSAAPLVSQPVRRGEQTRGRRR